MRVGFPGYRGDALGFFRSRERYARSLGEVLRPWLVS